VADLDPSLSIRLRKRGARRTFDVGPSSAQDGCWAVIETGEVPRVQLVVGAAAALVARDEIDRRVRALLEDGWTPV